MQIRNGWFFISFCVCLVYLVLEGIPHIHHNKAMTSMIYVCQSCLNQVKRRTWHHLLGLRLLKPCLVLPESGSCTSLLLVLKPGTLTICLLKRVLVLDNVARPDSTRGKKIIFLNALFPREPKRSFSPVVLSTVSRNRVRFFSSLLDIFLVE